MPSRKGHEILIFLQLFVMIKDNPCRCIWLRFCLYCFTCCLCVNLQAQQAGDSITGKVHAIPEVSVKGRKISSRITSATPTQSFSRKDFEALGLQGIADAVKRFSGVNVKDYGGLGGLKTISIRNLGAAHTAVSYDGIAVSNSQAGQIDIGRFATDNISTLSLSIGQSDNLLQSARMYASAGILHIVTEQPKFISNKKHNFHGQIKGGSFGLFNSIARWEQQVGTNSAFTIDGNFLRSDGTYPFTIENGKHTATEKRYNSDIFSYQGEINFFHQFSDSSHWNTKAYYYHSKRGLPGAVILYNPESNERLVDENLFLQTQWKKTFSPEWTLQVQGKYNYAYNRYQDKGSQYDSGKVTDRHTQKEYYLSASLLYQPIQNWTFSLSQDGVINTLDNTLPDCPYPTRYTSLTVLSSKYTFPHLTVQAHILGTYISEHVKKGSAPADLHRLSPSISMNYRPWKEHLFFIRAMYKGCFRTPTFNDLYYFRSGNKDLKPEKAQEYNIGITYGGSPFTFLNYCSITLDGYYNRVTDKIVAFPSTYVWRMQNYGKVRIIGMDATLSTEFPLTHRSEIHFSCGYTLQEAIDLTNPEAKNYKDQLPYTPKHSGNASATIETPWLNAGYTLMGVGKRYYLSQNIPENEIDGYLEHTLTISRNFKISNCKLRLQADVTNLTNKQYEVIKYYPMPGRSWTLSVSVQL